MGLFDFFKKKKENMVYAKTLNGYTPIFSQFGNDIYASDVIQQAINCIVREMKKLTPVHERKTDGISDSIVVNGKIQAVLDNPNELMTTSDFIEKIIWQLFLNYNSFILPTWTDGGELTGLYPIQPTQVDFLTDSTNRLYIKFRFANNYETTIRYSDIIHVRYNYSVNEFMGGDVNGQPDHNALIKILEINNTLLEGISKGIKASYAINGAVKYNTIMDEETMSKNLLEFEEKIKNSNSGFLPMDIKAEIEQFNRDIKVVDEATMKFIDGKILRHFGVSIPILTGNYTKEEYEAFYQKTLEPLIIILSQAFTKGIFTSRSSTGFGNKINFYAKELIFMNTSQKIEMVRLLGDSGTLFENEKRVMFGLKPLKELENIRKQSLNYVNVEIAGQYQLNQTKEVEDNGK